MRPHFLTAAILLSVTAPAGAQEFRHLGDFILKSHLKITDGRVSPIPVKAMAFHVYTDGLTIRVSAEDDPNASTSFDIYRSDGVGRRRAGGGGIEVIPGLQATSRIDGVYRHLRLSSESLTITTFPGVSDQTIVSHAVALVKHVEAPAKPSPENP
jgi:hypothetical protein